MKVRRIMVFSAALVAILMVAVPVSADSADFRFHVTPVRDTFYPGEETVLTLLIENDAKVSGFVVNENTSNLLPLITTARNLRIELNSKPPVEVKTINPQLAGDLPPGIVTKASFRIKIDPDAEEKEYELTVKIHYTYASYSIDPATNIAVITYDDDVYQKTVSILVSKKEYDFSIDILNSTAISGRESVVKAEIVNTGKNPVYDAYVVMNATPPLMANPGAMVVYVGDLSPGESKTVNFKVYTAENALNQSYPVNFILRFSDAAGYPKTLMKTVPLAVKGRKSIEVAAVESVIPPSQRMFISQKVSLSVPATQLPPTRPSGSLPTAAIQPSGSRTFGGLTSLPSRGYVMVTLRNTGEDMRDAAAVLSFDTPLIRVENSPYIGHLARNKSVKILFSIENFAQEGEYRGWIAVKYRNSQGDEVITEKHYISIEVGERPLKVEGVKAVLSAGQKGEIEVELKNGLSEKLEDIELTLLSPEPTLTPLTTTAYIGSLGGSETSSVRFRIGVDNEAILGNYTLYLLEKYAVRGTEIVSAAKVPVSVKSRGVRIEISSIEASLYPDSTGEVTIRLKNSGSTIYNSVVMLEVNPPLTIAGESSLSSLVGKPQVGTYFVGTLESGDTAIVKFRVKVDKDAGAGSYPANLKLSYYDGEGYRHETNDFLIAIEVKEKPLVTPVLITAVAMGLIALVLVAVVLRKRGAGKGS